MRGQRLNENRHLLVAFHLSEVLLGDLNSGATDSSTILPFPQRLKFRITLKANEIMDSTGLVENKDLESAVCRAG